MIVCVAGPMDAHNSQTVCVAGSMDAHNNETIVFVLLIPLRNLKFIECVGGSTSLFYSSILHVSVNQAPLPNWCVTKTFFTIFTLSICHSTNYEVSSVRPGKF